MPSVRELLGGDVHVGDLRKPTEADLLGRHKVETDLHAVSEYIKGKRVVVTGAGGSIGSELCRQLSAFEPGRARHGGPGRVRPPRRAALARRPGDARLGQPGPDRHPGPGAGHQALRRDQARRGVPRRGAQAPPAAAGAPVRGAEVERLGHALGARRGGRRRRRATSSTSPRTRPPTRSTRSATRSGSPRVSRRTSARTSRAPT